MSESKQDTIKLIIGLLIVGIVAVGGFLYWHSNSSFNGDELKEAQQRTQESRERYEAAVEKNDEAQKNLDTQVKRTEEAQQKVDALR